MAVTDPTIDPIAYLVEAGTPPPKQEFTDFKPFFFAIGNDEKALVRPLLNLITDGQVQLVEAYKHEYWDNTTKKWLFRNLCAKNEGIELECQSCLDVEAMPESTKEEKDAKRKSSAVVGNREHSSRRFVLPVYVHQVWKCVDRQRNKWEQLTYKTQDGQEHFVSGPRLMEMKPAYSPIFHDLSQAYQASESHDITRRDFTIERTQGSDGFPKYTTTPRDLSPFTPAEHDIPVGYLSKDGVFNLYQEACPPRIVGESNNNDPFITTALPGDKPATNGTIKNAPDF